MLLICIWKELTARLFSQVAVEAAWLPEVSLHSVLRPRGGEVRVAGLGLCGVRVGVVRVLALEAKDDVAELIPAGSKIKQTINQSN